MNIGIMGGTFNPIHNAHLMIAQTARDEYKLDEVWFLTSGNPPHKLNENIVDADVRHEMVMDAIKSNPHFKPCSYEVERVEYSYTFATLENFTNEYPDHTFYFIIGGDSLHYFHKWYRPDIIAKLCTILVFSRSGCDVEEDIEFVRKEFCADIQLIHSPTFDISSSYIRENIKLGKSVRYLIPDEVNEYIVAHHLYIDD